MTSKKRLFYLLFTFFIFIGISFAFCSFSKITLDKGVIILVLGIVYVSVFTISIIRKRLASLIYPGTDYSFYPFAFLLCFLITFISRYFDEFFYPFAILPMVLCAAFSADLALGAGIYFYILADLCFGLSEYGVYFYIFSAVITTYLCNYLKEKKFKFSILIGFLEFFSIGLLGIMFSYLSDFEMERENIIYILVGAFISAFFMVIVYNFLVARFKAERIESIEKLASEKYPLMRDLKQFSQAEYKHALRLSALCAGCATIIGADADICRLAGLYYHGANMEKNGSKAAFLKKLNNRCFPPEVIIIVSEEGSKGGTPSTKESAIVHMTDAVITKFEAIFAKADKSSWNLTMVVYQTLNELSGAGLYDKSGLSMNEFLLIRNYLAQSEFF